MTSVMQSPARITAAAPAQAQAHALARFWLVALLGWALSIALNTHGLREVLQTGAFNDPDDALRMVQVRDWMSGQGWFDLHAWRMDPPTGVFMHWSRVVDVPMAGLILFFRLFADPTFAERLARVAFPILLQLAIILGLMSAARRLAGEAASVPAAALAALSGMTFGQFEPGRIGHHAPQITLLVAMVAGMLAAFDLRHAKAAALSAACMALSLAISLENLPFIAILSAALPLVWVVRGDAMRPALKWFGASLAACLALALVATIAPSRWFVLACDAYSGIQMGAGLAGAALCLGLAALSPILITVRARLIAVAGSGLIFGLCLLAMFPSCFSDPFSHMDPVVFSLLMPQITEARPLNVLFAMRPWVTGLLLIAPLGLSMLAGLVMLMATRGIARLRWLLLTFLCTAGFALCFWEIRVSGSLQPLTLISAAGAVAHVSTWLAKRWRVSVALLGVGLSLPFAPVSFALAAGDVPDDNPVETAQAARIAACRSPQALEAFVGLPPGLVLAPIIAGSHILVSTPMAVLGAAYHRNNHGNRTTLDTFRAPPTEALVRLHAAHAAYVATCPGSAIAEEAMGLGAALANGDSVEGLTPLPVRGPWRIFAVTQP